MTSCSADWRRSWGQKSEIRPKRLMSAKILSLIICAKIWNLAFFPLSIYNASKYRVWITNIFLFLLQGQRNLSFCFLLVNWTILMEVCAFHFHTDRSCLLQLLHLLGIHCIRLWKFRWSKSKTKRWKSMRWGRHFCSFTTRTKMLSWQANRRWPFFTLVWYLFHLFSFGLALLVSESRTGTGFEEHTRIPYPIRTIGMKDCARILVLYPYLIGNGHNFYARSNFVVDETRPKKFFSLHLINYQP